jgi:hypothetical protein
MLAFSHMTSFRKVTTKFNLIYYRRLPLPSAWVQNKNSLFYRQMIISVISASAWPKTIFLHRQIRIFYHGIFFFYPCGHSFLNVNLISSTPMRSSTLQEGRQSWSNKVKGVGHGENNIKYGKFTSAWVSIINFFRHIKFRHGPQIICRCRRQRQPSVVNKINIFLREKQRHNKTTVLYFYYAFAQPSRKYLFSSPTPH